ncbi:MAG: Mur ligase family protein, partial [Opitutus sp.]
MSLTTPKILESLLTQPVAILGGGVSGAGVCSVLADLGVGSVIYDQKSVAFTAKAARAHRLVVFSPGFPPEHPWLTLARAAGAECRGELDFASLFWRGSVVAVTGTNGKTTVTEFITHALKTIGLQAQATGNVGHSFAQLVAETAGGTTESIAVCEVSSFQAETMKDFHADATLWTNFAEDHLERHPTLETYFGAKWNLIVRTVAKGGQHRRIGKRTSDNSRRSSVFLGSSVQRFAQKFDRPLPEGSVVDTEFQPADARLAGTVFADYPQRENFLLVAAWWTSVGL